MAAVGRTLVTLGLLILLFVAYQLWGTGIYEARAQSRLRDDFEAQLEQAQATTTVPTTATPTTAPVTPATDPPEPTTTTTLPPLPPTQPGDPVAIIRIPRIDVERVVVEGVDLRDLRKGPGRYPLSAYPGHPGNAAIAGHRTTYGAPFNRLQELEDGDAVEVVTVYGTFTYRVTDSFVVKPSAVEVLDATAEPTLTLTTCHPKYSAAERLVVKARLDTEASEEPTAAPPTTPVDGSGDGSNGESGTGGGSGAGTATTLDGPGLSGGRESRTPTTLWGLLAAAVGGAWWLLFHRYRHWSTWLAGVAPFLVVLFFFYSHLERLLPSNY